MGNGKDPFELPNDPAHPGLPDDGVKPPVADTEHIGDGVGVPKPVKSEPPVPENDNDGEELPEP